jgi:hypothetical protein
MSDATSRPSPPLGTDGDRNDADCSQRPPVTIDHIRCVRSGHGANCSSIGSVVDTLFVTATVGAAVFAAVVAALKREDVHIRHPSRGKEESEGKTP